MIKGILHKIDRQTALKRLLLCIALFSAPCSMFNVFAQITIGGNVYGGGNAGATEGQTKVVVRAGEIKARSMAVPVRLMLKVLLSSISTVSI